ncbi:metalloregulator ArsR/SmtB family transcription factor [Sulfurivirga sp.]|uniref:ArsR/SmtB family transcription factor n=1 Tax=Sulfurivirga sp. TaxID=2614236 RepID=UPI0025E773D8|nr:metalloregulator ArsR/SmtB family transcription factor [Sulfurivirga sp.]
MTLKKEIYEQIAQMAQQLASPQRLEMLEYLAQAPRSVEELAELAGLSVANTSRHLQQLRRVGLVTVERAGRQRIYHLAGDDIVQAIRCLRRSAEKHLAEISRILEHYWQEQGELPAIDFDTLRQIAKEDRVLLLDVRPPEEYARGHIPGALNVPPDQIDTFLEHFDPKGKTVVAYCRGPYCTFSHKAVSAMRSKAIQALRLEEGLPEWRAEGGAIETFSQPSA